LMFLPVAGSRLSGRRVSAETMFLENVSPHCGWSFAEAGAITTELQSNATVNKLKTSPASFGNTDSLPQMRQHVLYMLFTSGRRSMVQGNEDSFIDPTRVYLSSA